MYGMFADIVVGALIDTQIQIHLLLTGKFTNRTKSS